MGLQERARALRKIIETSVQFLDDSEALKSVELYPEWKPNTEYVKDQRVQYNKILYKCLQNHTSIESWDPVNAPSLFARVLIPDPDVIPEWVQPDSTNPYMTGDKVRFEGKTYESLIDNNIWSPTAYPAGWKEI